MSRRNALIILMICVISWIALSRCGRQDVSADPKYRGGYVPGATYRLLVDVEYFKENSGFITHGATYNGSHGATVPKGVRVQLDRIELEHNFEAGDLVHFMGHFVDGPFAGRKISLDGVTILTTNGDQRNPKILEPVP